MRRTDVIDLEKAYCLACDDLAFMAQDQQWPNADWLVKQFDRLAAMRLAHRRTDMRFRYR